jgi:hypothetical protein
MGKTSPDMYIPLALSAIGCGPLTRMSRWILHFSLPSESYLSKEGEFGLFDEGLRLATTYAPVSSAATPHA